MQGDISSAALRGISATIRDYVSIARPKHWVKHVFIFPGILAAAVLSPTLSVADIAGNIVLGLISACLIASANYVINEWLDAEYDKHHPLKSNRPAAAGRLNVLVVYAEYALLGLGGILVASLLGGLFLVASALFLLSGIIYNVQPARTKDRLYLDVLSEAINNPIRLVLGWAMISNTTVPPLSLFGAFWMGGAFLMAAKRLSEFRLILDRSGPAGPGRYRRSFRFYTVESLLISCFIYALLAAFFISIFLIKYREEYVLSFPLIATMFAYYLHLGLQTTSVAQRPESLHQDKVLVSIVVALSGLLLALSFIDLPLLVDLIQSRFVDLQP